MMSYIPKYSLRDWMTEDKEIPKNRLVSSCIDGGYAVHFFDRSGIEQYFLIFGDLRLLPAGGWSYPYADISVFQCQRKVKTINAVCPPVVDTIPFEVVFEFRDPDGTKILIKDLRIVEGRLF